MKKNDGPDTRQFVSVPSYDDTLSALTMEQFQHENLRRSGDCTNPILDDDCDVGISQSFLPRIIESSRSPRSNMSPNSPKSQRSQRSQLSSRSQKSLISNGSYSRSASKKFTKRMNSTDLVRQYKQEQLTDIDETVNSLSDTESEAGETHMTDGNKLWAWFHCCGMEIRVAPDDNQDQIIRPLDSETFYDCVVGQSQDETSYNKSVSLETSTEEVPKDMPKIVVDNAISINYETTMTRSHSGTISTCDYPESLGLTTHKSDDFTKISNSETLTHDKSPKSTNIPENVVTSDDSLSIDLISHCDSILTKSDCDIDIISQHDSIITKNNETNSDERDDKGEGHSNAHSKSQQFNKLKNLSRQGNNGFRAFPKMSSTQQHHYVGTPGRGQVRRNFQLIINNSSTMSVDSSVKKKTNKLSKLLGNSTSSLNNTSSDTTLKTCKNAFDASTIRSKYGSQSRASGSGSSGSYKKRPAFVQVMSSGLIPSTALKVSSRKR